MAVTRMNQTGFGLVVALTLASVASATLYGVPASEEIDKRVKDIDAGLLTNWLSETQAYPEPARCVAFWQRLDEEVFGKSPSMLKADKPEDVNRLLGLVDLALFENLSFSPAEGGQKSPLESFVVDCLSSLEARQLEFIDQLETMTRKVGGQTVFEWQDDALTSDQPACIRFWQLVDAHISGEMQTTCSPPEVYRMIGRGGEALLRVLAFTLKDEYIGLASFVDRCGILLANKRAYSMAVAQPALSQVQPELSQLNNRHLASAIINRMEGRKSSQ